MDLPFPQGYSLPVGEGGFHTRRLMATFQAQVEALTGLTLTSSSNPSTTELSQFLIDGYNDVIDRWLTIRPQDGLLFCAESSTSTSQGGLGSDSGRVITVVRKDGNGTMRD